ncbi:hypothetical protein QOT17_000105 [Balamuthia mandrillaris]
MALFRFRQLFSFCLFFFSVLLVSLVNGQIATIESDTFYAEWNDTFPSFHFYAKDPVTGLVRREDHFNWEFLAFQEKSWCTCCRKTTFGQTVINCDDVFGTNTPVELTSEVAWRVEEVVPGEVIAWTADKFVNANNATLQVVFQALNSNSSFVMSNGQTDRILKFGSGGLKFTFNITNYEPTLFDINEEPERYFGMSFYVRFSMTRPMYEDPLTGIVYLDGAPQPHQLSVAMRTRDEPFLTVSSTQTTFSVNDPPSVSKESLPEEEWGFENVDGLMRGVYIVDGQILGQVVEFLIAGSRSVFYDPDLSITFTGGEMKEGEDDEKDDEWVIPVAVGVVGGVFLVTLVVLVVAVFWRRVSLGKSKRRTQLLSQKMQALNGECK